MTPTQRVCGPGSRGRERNPAEGLEHWPGRGQASKYGSICSRSTQARGGTDQQKRVTEWQNLKSTCLCDSAQRPHRRGLSLGRSRVYKRVEHYLTIPLHTFTSVFASGLFLPLLTHLGLINSRLCGPRTEAQCLFEPSSFVLILCHDFDCKC